MSQFQLPMNIEQIQKLLPHRYPFLLIDRVLSLDPGPHPKESRQGSKAVAYKNVTANEPFFTGHFPHKMIMPGVLLIEAMAQTCVICAYTEANIKEPNDFYIASVREAKFRKPVIPGDTVYMYAEMIKDRKSMMVYHVVAKVNEEEVASCEILAKMFPSGSNH